MMHRYLCVLLLSIGLLADRTAAEAQTVFIPDTNLRVWLNTAKPNSVDALGNCDSAAWNAQPPNSVGFSFTVVPNFGSVDLEGMQYLKMPTLYMNGTSLDTISVTYPGHPPGMTQLVITEVDVNSINGQFWPLPNGLDIFNATRCGLTGLPAFTGTRLWIRENDLGGQVLNVPPTVTSLRLNDCNITQVPSIPNVTELEVNDDPLGTLTNLPPGLLSLSAHNAGLSTLPALPPNLQTLVVSSNALSSLPPLPNLLMTLDITNNQFTVLDSLPPLLYTLYVKTNPIPVLPALPASLWRLDGSYSGLTSLPSPLPPALTILTMYNTAGLTALPALPSSLAFLEISGTAVAQLPALPQSLTYLRAMNNTALTCLPALPPQVFTLRLANSGVSCIPNIPPALVPGLNNIGIAPVVCNPGTSPCPIVDPLIIGTTFSDADVDGVFDVGEATRPNATVIAQPGDLLAGSDINGNYVLPANVGSFSVTGVPGLYEPVTTAPYAVTFTALGQVDSLNHIGFNVIPGMYDLVTTITSTNVRPGFNTGVWVTVHNVGTEPTTATVQLTFDAALSYVSSSEVPDAVNGNVVDWTTPSIVPGGSWTVWVELYGPPALVLGSPVVQQATATPSQPDQTPADNTYILNDVVVGSFDPNDKKVEPSTLSLLDVASGTRVEYTVRFQNTGTFPAERVLITDTLSSDLQWATMQVLGSSHTHTWYIHNGVLHVLFESINLSDSVSDEPGSHGFVKFSFVPSNTLITGDAVGNIANIYFDFNEPVITNDALFYVETSLAVDGADADGLRAWPNPAQDVLFVALDGATIGTLSVVDATGREVLSTTIGARAELHIGALAAGPYLLRCTNSKGVRTSHLMKH